MRSRKKLEVTTRERYLRQVEQHAASLAQRMVLDTTPMKRWAERALEKLKGQGRLVTEAQFRDYRSNRVLRVGDRAMYVGPNRVEDTENGPFTRPHGQLGDIVAVERRGAEFIVTFRPDATAATAHVVELRVITNTPGYYTIQRVIPDDVCAVSQKDSGRIPERIPVADFLVFLYI